MPRSNPRPRLPAAHHLKGCPLAMVENGLFLASTAALIWLVNTYFPPGPILRLLFPLPMALVYLRWGPRGAWMSALDVGAAAFGVNQGPPRSLLFFDALRRVGGTAWVYLGAGAQLVYLDCGRGLCWGP